MLDFAVAYRQAVDQMTGDRTMDLRALELDDEEWELVTQLRDVLKVSHTVTVTLFFSLLSQVFDDATQFFSRSHGSPLISAVIPAMDFIDSKLTSNSIDVNLKASIRAACALAKKTLNRYYSKTDDSHVYRIAMRMSISSSGPMFAHELAYSSVLNPEYKLEYCKTASWPTDWISTMRELARRTWLDKYASMEFDEVVVDAVPPATVSSNNRSVRCLHSIMHRMSQQTSSMLSPPLRRQLQLILVPTSSTPSSHRHVRASTVTFLVGGTLAEQCTHGCLAWRSTIL